MLNDEAGRRKYISAEETGCYIDIIYHITGGAGLIFRRNGHAEDDMHILFYTIYL